MKIKHQTRVRGGGGWIIGWLVFRGWCVANTARGTIWELLGDCSWTKDPTRTSSKCHEVPLPRGQKGSSRHQASRKYRSSQAHSHVEQMTYLSETKSTSVYKIMWNFSRRSKWLGKNRRKAQTNKVFKRIRSGLPVHIEGRRMRKVDRYTSSRGEGQERIVQKTRIDHGISPCLDISKLISTAALWHKNISMTAQIFLLSSDKQLLRGWYIETALRALDFETLGYLVGKFVKSTERDRLRCIGSHGQADPALFIQRILSVDELGAGYPEAGTGDFESRFLR